MKTGRYNWMTILSLILSGCLAFGNGLSAAAAEADTYGRYISGEGAAENRKEESEFIVMTISTEEELSLFARECSLDSWSRDKYVKLENDIVLQEEKEIVIPSFGGIFDGCGHKISGLDIHMAGSSAGLFRYIQAGGTVRNLTVSGRVCPEGSAGRAGLLAGVNYGRIIDCSVFGTVTGTEKTGGIAGVNEAGGEMRNCLSAAIVTGNHYTGGICGVNRGTLNHCSNTGSINTYSTDVTYDLEHIEEIARDGFEDMENMEQVGAHTDTGGVAGYSEGKIYYCSNSGTVGYRHVGYNTGGIAGRLHQGYLQSCTNTGHILGRKDVGGIAGQMEPFLEIQYLNDALGEIDAEAKIFFDLLEAAQEDLDNYGGQAGELSRSISGHLRNVSAAGGNLTGTANDLWYIYNQELTGINQDLSRLNQEWSDLAAKEKDEGTDTAPDNGESEGDRNHFTVSGNEVILPGESWGGNIDISALPDIESYLAALRRFGEGTGGHLSNITDATGDRSGGINEELRILNQEMSAAGDELQQLTDVLDRGGSEVSGNMNALIAQARVLRRSVSGLRDALFRYEGISIEDQSDEAAGETGDLPGEETLTEIYYDTSSFQQGKITLCINRGTVEADTNVGGIVGQVATEYDFDPEDDITLSGEESFHIEQTVKAVIRESRNLGEITGKKDCVGGIAGKADYGAVISCESYGRVESTDGSYVGGIAGISGYCIRSCYFLGGLSGKNYVGGIAGRGCDIFYSYACADLEYSGEYAGAIAGKLKEEGMISGNYYVQGNVPGVDSIGYEGGAAPLDYREFCSREEVPEAFSSFTVSFQAQGKELASFQCGYGEALDRSLIPEIPEKKGYYGVWPEFDYDYITGNKVLEADYEKWITSLASEEKDEEGRTLLLAEGRFLPKTGLALEQKDGEITFSIGIKDDRGKIINEYKEPVTVRVLCENQKGVVELWNGSSYSRVSAERMGSYLEFAMESPGTFRIVYPEKDDGSLIIAVSAGAGGAVLIVIFLFVLRKRRIRKRR